MAITRREFLRYSAVTGAALALGIFDLNPIKAYALANPPVWTAEALSVGVYCSGGCGMIVGKGTLPGYTGEYITYVQGNPDSIINAGRICSKCASSAQISTIIDPTSNQRVPNPNRITQPMHRAAGATDWTPITWTDAISQIAAKTLAARTAGWEASVGGVTCNRTTRLAALGGSSLNNEAAYMMSKLYRALGLVYIETQARN
jgi:formate dehydrogenase major subunit